MTKLVDSFARGASTVKTACTEPPDHKWLSQLKQHRISGAIRSSRTVVAFKNVAAPVELGDSKVRIALVYNKTELPDPSDIMGFVAHEYPGMEISDITRHHPGYIELIITPHVITAEQVVDDFENWFAQTAQMDPGNLPAVDMADQPAGSSGSKRGPAVGEEIEGTGVIAQYI